ncbi:MAG: ATP-binding protein [Epsilonproteobacteria bacterium]|nr:ATP-binding protein [Campylobacterota bacterium]
MKYVIDFIEKKDVSKTLIYSQLKCSKEEGEVLRYLTKQYVEGNEEVSVIDVLSDLFPQNRYKYLEKLSLIKNLLELGWIIQHSLTAHKTNETSLLELLNSTVSLSASFLKLLEKGDLELALPEVTPYNDHLEYLKDQFSRIDIYQKISSIRKNYSKSSLNINRLKNRLQLLEKRINDRLKVTKIPIEIEKLFKEHKLEKKERIIFLALLKEEYSGDFDNLRDMNALVDLVSFDEYEKIKNRALLEEGSKLIESGLIDYDEMLTAFGGVSRNFYISEDILYKIIHPNKEKRKKRVKLDMLIKEQDIFELIEPKTSLEDVVLNQKTREILNNILKQMDKKVQNLLKEWGIKEKKKGIDAKLIFYGPPGTGKTMTAVSFAKSLKKKILSFDCSKILSMYVGESEKNVRKIFDTYYDLKEKTKSEPVLLLNEADQFLSARSTGLGSSADKMHNQMQNIFLEQIEKFEGILIATTNLLENIDPAFSRRFDYKIAFEKPNFKERVELWKKMLPKNAQYAKNFNIETLAKYDLTGGQIHVVIKNTALKVAVKENPVFTVEDFIPMIQREKSGTFGESKSLGFM